VFAKLFPIALLLAALAAPARGEETLLRGPHPFNQQNFIALHAGWGLGFGDAPVGPRLQGDYQYRLSGPAWLDLQMGVLAGDCRGRAQPCGAGTGKAVDILAGAAWNFQTSVPLVPYARVAAGPVFLFPEGVRSSAGFLLRGGAGIHYFFYDWFGVGAEITLAWGLAVYDLSALRSGNLTTVDGNVGVRWHF